MEQREHLTEEGLQKIRNIRKEIDKKRLEQKNKRRE